MGVKKWTLTLLLCLLFPFWAHAQRFNFKTVTVNNGLPHGKVHDLYQTHDSYLWIATNGGGLTRFDGSSFKTFTQNDGLPSNSIHRIYEDSDLNLWIAAEPGGVFTFKKDSLINPFPNSPISDFEVWRIEESPDGNIWFGTYNGGIFIWNGESMRRLTVDDGLISNSIWDFHFDGSNVWIATEEGITVLGDRKQHYTVTDGLSGKRVYKIVEDSSQTKWIATNNGITTWDGKRFSTIEQIGEESLNYVFDIEIASTGDIWIGTETKGVFVYDGAQFDHYTYENGLSSNYIYELYVDRNGNMWVATNEDGVNLYKGDTFVFYNEDFGLSEDEVLSVLWDSNNTLWMGTRDGLESYDGDKVYQYELPNTYENSYIRDMEELPNGNLLVAMPDGELMEFDGEQCYSFTDKHGLNKWLIQDLFIDSKKHLWIATDQGIYTLKEGDLNHITTDDGLVSDVVTYIREGSDGSFYIGTNQGLSLYQDDTFRNFTDENGLGNNVVNYITEDSRGNIWLGTSGGISTIVPEEDYGIFNFDRNVGMKLVGTHFLWFDDVGYLWQATNSGLNRLDVPTFWETGTMNLKYYALTNWGTGVEFNHKAISEDSAGDPWFGSMEGVIHLDKSKLEKWEEIKTRPVQITDIKRNGSRINWEEHVDSLTYLHGNIEFPSVEFSYGEHSYTFSYVGLNYFHPSYVKYRYKLKGFEEDWRSVTTGTTATYTNLEPGDYEFIVQSLNGNDFRDATSDSYRFSIAPPFWSTYWFLALLLGSAGALIFGYIRYKVNKVEKKELKKKVDKQTEYLSKALEEKEVLIKEIHHRVKNNLAVISGLLELQRGYADDKFVHKVLSESQRRVQSISMIHEKLYQNEKLAEIDFEKYVSELVEIIAYSLNHADRDIEVDIEVEDFKLGIDQGIPCGLILNELISNAFEHAFKGKKKGNVTVSIRLNGDGSIKMAVVDDGVGIPEDFGKSQQESLGITLIETLVQQLEGTLTVEKNCRGGTTFTITFEKAAAPKQVPLDEE